MKIQFTANNSATLTTVMPIYKMAKLIEDNKDVTLDKLYDLTEKHGFEVHFQLKERYI